MGKGPDVRVKVSKGQWVMVGKGLKSNIQKVGKGGFGLGLCGLGLGGLRLGGLWLGWLGLGG